VVLSYFVVIVRVGHPPPKYNRLSIFAIARIIHFRNCVFLSKASMKEFFALSILLISSAAFAESCALETYASSWMATGTPFSIKCPSGKYSGPLVATPARRFFRRGQLMLKFDQPIAVVSKNTTDEGKIQPGRGKQITILLIAGGVGIGAKDITDGLSGAVYKS
jgi:hypothetical protein